MRACDQGLEERIGPDGRRPTLLREATVLEKTFKQPVLERSSACPPRPPKPALEVGERTCQPKGRLFKFRSARTRNKRRHIPPGCLGSRYSRRLIDHAIYAAEASPAPPTARSGHEWPSKHKVGEECTRVKMMGDLPESQNGQMVIMFAMARYRRYLHRPS